MLFSSIPFLYYFLPAVLILYFLVPQKLKNAVLNNRWMCGFPDRVLIRAFGDSYVVMAFGVNDAMNPFETHLTAVYPGMETIASETIS